MLDYSHISSSGFDAHFHSFYSILQCHLVLPFAVCLLDFMPTLRYLSPYQPKPLLLISLISGSCFSLAALKFNNVQKCAVVLFTEVLKHVQECSPLPRKRVGFYHLNSRAHLTTKKPQYMLLAWELQRAGCVSKGEHGAGREGMIPVISEHHWSGGEGEKSCIVQATSPTFLQAGKLWKRPKASWPLRSVLSYPANTSHSS